MFAQASFPRLEPKYKENVKTQPTQKDFKGPYENLTDFYLEV